MNEEAGERLLAVIRRTLAESHDARFETMAEVANALEASLLPLPRTMAQREHDDGGEAPSVRFVPTRLFPVHALEQRPEGASPPSTASAPAPLAIRQPARPILLPLAHAALLELAQTVPFGFRKALLMVTLDLENKKARLFVQLVATDELCSSEASSDLVSAAGAMIGADARDGNGGWQRLVLRLVRGSDEIRVADVV